MAKGMKDSPETQKVEGEILETLGQMRSGEISSMSKEQADLLKQDLAQNARSRGEATLKTLNRDLVRRGIFRSGIANKNAREVRLSVDREIATGERDIEMKRLAAEYTDKMAWLDKSQAWLTQKRNYDLGKEQLAVQREGIRAQYAVGMAGVEAQRYGARLSAGAAGARLKFDKEQFKYQKQQAKIDRQDRRFGQMMNYFSGMG
jgi:hypothetical protein